MFERNDDIARNTLEVLRRQFEGLQREKATLLGRLAAGQAQLAELRRRHERDARLSFGLAFSVSLAIGLALAFQVIPSARLSWSWYW